ncbi:DUF7096 domain-containing protein [Natronolimnobius baerhuensis]|uniref:Uncharacterized protein n=1 Tax=Natronolimnobius baerhuensis TaxID=253108 RepID=A0A202E9Y6_9EURY|nr:hypothetical protein [Natronolimnobius baerhuensis]OVE85065.1 hypothetical protein B2G88_11995 [Natronolimnobius baerhuensis]
MNSATPVLLALLLVCSVPAITVVAASPERGVVHSTDERHAFQQNTAAQTTPVEIENTTNQLSLTGDIRGSHAETETDFSAVLAGVTTQLQVDHETYVLSEHTFTQADDERQTAMVESAYDRLKDRINTLEEREREAVQDHAVGEISDAELIQVLLQNYQEATTIEETLDELDTRDDLLTESALSSQQLRADRTLLDFHTTSIRTNLDMATGMEESSESYEFRIQTSQDGYRLSQLDGRTYTTEIVRFDNRNADAPNQYQSTDQAMDQATGYYPWANEHGTSDFHDRSQETLYWLDIAHDEGQLNAYLDGGTGDIYREMQDISANSLPITETETKSYPGLELTLNKTPVTGPSELTVVDTNTGEPVQSTVEVDGVELGETDEDGSISYLPPAEEYNLTVDSGSESVSTSISTE